MINGLIDSSGYGLQVCDMDYANYFKRHTFQTSDSKKNVQYGSDRSLFDHQMGGVSCINWINYFHWLSLDLKSVIIDFIISADSQS